MTLPSYLFIRFRSISCHKLNNFNRRFNPICNFYYMINFCTLKSAGHPGNYGVQLVACNSVTCVSPVSPRFIIIPWGVFGSSVMHGQRLSEYIFSVFFYSVYQI
jgi:hypothetical protein